jgi:hypothetical protein
MIHGDPITDNVGYGIPGFFLKQCDHVSGDIGCVRESHRSVSSSRDGSKLVGDIDERGHRCHVRFEGFGAPVIEEATVDHSRVGKTGLLQQRQIFQLVFDCGEELEMPLEISA